MNQERKPAKLTTDYLKKVVIPATLTDSEIARICAQFDPPLNFEEEKIAMRSPRNWSRIIKSRTPSRDILRVFNYTPQEDQLRSYITSDPTDTQVRETFFQDE